MRAVFLDRDGVINRNLDTYVRSIEDLEMIPGSLEAIAQITSAGLGVVIVTNQSQVGRGITSRTTVDAINREVVRQVRAAGGRVDAVMTCYHAPEAECACRKPRPGMLVDAAARLRINLERSYLVGDAVSDLRAAHAAGCQPLMVRTGRGLPELISGIGADLARSRGILVAADLASASTWILDRETVGQPAARVLAA